MEEIFFLFLIENLEQKDSMEQEHQEYYYHEQSNSSIEEMEDKSEINPPKDGFSVLAARQAQAD